MPKAHLNGIDIAYETYGDGYPIVLAHGLAATKESWDGQIGPFMERYRARMQERFPQTPVFYGFRRILISASKSS